MLAFPAHRYLTTVLSARIQSVLGANRDLLSLLEIIASALWANWWQGSARR